MAETTAARLRAEPGVAQRELREADEDDYVVRAKPLSLGQVQALPVPGKLELGGDAELELIPTEGHTADGMAVWAPFAGVLVVRRLRLAGRDPDDLRERLAQRVRRDAAAAGALRRAGRVGRARPRRRRSTARAPLAILREDVKYLESLGGAGEPALPLARRDRVQQKLHAENVARVGASS